MSAPTHTRTCPPPLPLSRALDELGLTAVLLFLAVSATRWLRAPSSPIYVADLGIALAVIGAFSGVVLVALILSPPGRHSGGHMNPAVTIAFLPPAIAVALTAIIALLGPLSGGSANPARQWGPALLSAQGTDLWIYLVAPVLGAVLGAGLHHLLIRRFNTHQPLSYNLSGPEPARPRTA